MSGMSKSVVLGWNWAFCAGAGAASFALVSPRFAASLLLGAAIETLNFRSFWRSSEQLLGLSNASRIALGAFGLRFVLLAAALYFALQVGAHPVGLVVGLSMIVPAVVLAAWKARPDAGLASLPVPPPDDPSWDEWNPWTARERAPRDDDEEWS